MVLAGMLARFLAGLVSTLPGSVAGLGVADADMPRVPLVFSQLSPE